MPKRKKRTPERKLDRRPLHLKIRVTARKGMVKSKDDLLAIIEGIVDSGTVPDGVTVHWIDWRKGTGGRANAGRIEETEVIEGLKDFWGALTHPTHSDVRAFKVKGRTRREI